MGWRDRSQVCPSPVAIAVVVAALSPFLAGWRLEPGNLDAAEQLGPHRAGGPHAMLSDAGTLIRALIASDDPALGSTIHAVRSELDELYRPGHESPLWVDVTGRPTSNARVALALLRHAADHGLNPADYDLDLDRFAGALDDVSPAATDVARFDVAMSAAMVRYLRHLHQGRIDPRSIGFRLDAPRDSHDFPALLRTALADQRIREAAAALQPPMAQYRALVGMLARYRELARDPAFVAPPAIATAIHPGQPYAAAPLLYRDLTALGDLPRDVPPPPEAGRYEGGLVAGVKTFQAHHGLDPDGILGRNTMAALQVPLAWRVRQIELALERLRWLPHLGNERLIALNIPMFRLWVWDAMPPDGLPLLGMNVIVGRALNTQTPVFAEQMREVIFRPYWNVPRSIVRHEVLPAIEHDPDYLRREDMEIVAGAGDGARLVPLTPAALAGLRSGALRVRQRPGPTNALGLIKFNFPNQENVYMHGTPAQALFARNRRDFSHGCVRVADPVALAEWVLRDRPEWTRDRIVAAAAGSRTIHVPLPRPIQVVLFYTTAAVMPEEGTIAFAEDIYGHDAKLDRALADAPGRRMRDSSGKLVKSPTTLRTLMPVSRHIAPF